MLTEGLELPVEPGRIYAGQTGATKWPSGNTGKATLRSRIGSQHVRGRIRGSTFRLTLASSLHRSLGLVPLGPRRLGDDSERLLTEWIMSHLDLAVHPYADPDPLADLEHQVLLRLDPPLNLDGMPRTPVRLRLAERRAVLAAGVPQSESEPTTCANCGKLTTQPNEDGWRYYSTGVGELLPFCIACASREFGLPEN